MRFSVGKDSALVISGDCSWPLDQTVIHHLVICRNMLCFHVSSVRLIVGRELTHEYTVQVHVQLKGNT